LLAVVSLFGLLLGQLLLLFVCFLVWLKHVFPLLRASLKILALEVMSIHETRKLIKSESSDNTVSITLQVFENWFERVEFLLVLLDEHLIFIWNFIK